jgi:hypothetical protein
VGILAQFKVSEYKLGILPLKHCVSLYKQGIDHKTILAVTNAAVELASILATFNPAVARSKVINSQFFRNIFVKRFDFDFDFEYLYFPQLKIHSA